MGRIWLAKLTEAPLVEPVDTPASRDPPFETTDEDAAVVPPRAELPPELETALDVIEPPLADEPPELGIELNELAPPCPAPPLELPPALELAPPCPEEPAEPELRLERDAPAEPPSPPELLPCPELPPPLEPAMPSELELLSLAAPPELRNRPGPDG
jgi:hypothetical protein